MFAAETISMEPHRIPEPADVGGDPWEPTELDLERSFLGCSSPADVADAVSRIQKPLDAAIVPEASCDLDEWAELDVEYSFRG
jgi:hypothetical protein